MFNIENYSIEPIILIPIIIFGIIIYAKIIKGIFLAIFRNWFYTFYEADLFSIIVTIVICGCQLFYIVKKFG